MKQRIIEWMKRETVLVIALVLALVSSFVVIPGREYIDYIDFRTLGLLFCLMCSMAGFQKLGIFSRVSRLLLSKVKTAGGIVMVLMLLTFFFSMVITNDVALITFVPLTIIVFQLIQHPKKETLLITAIVMETIAANLGSMTTPIGNPQNLYLYGKSTLGMLDFILLMLPFSGASLVFLCIWCLLLWRRAENRTPLCLELQEKEQGFSGWSCCIYVVLFGISLLTVMRVLPAAITFGIHVAVLLLFDRGILKRVDYGLLLTFVGFFIFIGNMGRIPEIAMWIRSMIEGREILLSVLASQCISNVPAALLLSGFTEELRLLIIGTNLGGLGTLIASMASLISYKYYTSRGESKKGAYFIEFTRMNVLFLLLLSGLLFFFQ